MDVRVFQEAMSACWAERGIVEQERGRDRSERGDRMETQKWGSTDYGDIVKLQGVNEIFESQMVE